MNNEITTALHELTVRTFHNQRTVPSHHEMLGYVEFHAPYVALNKQKSIISSYRNGRQFKAMQRKQIR